MMETPYIALCAEQHKQFSYRINNDFSFLKNTKAVAVGLSELPFIIRHYPVLFMGEKAPVPVAIISLNGKENTFIDKTGKWLPDCYIPAIARLYPFALQKLPEQDAGIMLFNKTSTGIRDGAQDKKAVRLFQDNGQPSELLMQIATANAQFYNEKKKSEKFGSLLANAKILTESTLSIKNVNHNENGNTKLYTINENAYRSLPTEVLDAWFREGWIDAAGLVITAQIIWAEWLAYHQSASNGMSV